MTSKSLYQKVHSLMKKYLKELNGITEIQQSCAVQYMLSHLKYYSSHGYQSPIIAVVTETEIAECKAEAKKLIETLSKECKLSLLALYVEEPFMHTKPTGYVEQSLKVMIDQINKIEAEFKYKLRKM